MIVTECLTVIGGEVRATQQLNLTAGSQSWVPNVDWLVQEHAENPMEYFLEDAPQSESHTLNSLSNSKT